MKKVKFLFGLVALLATTMLSSCSKCQVCCDGGDCEQLCQDDFDSKQQYNAYIKLLETYGYSCSKK